MGIPCGGTGRRAPSRSGEYAGASSLDRSPAETETGCGPTKCEECNREFESSSDLKKQYCKNIEFEGDGEGFRKDQALKCADYYENIAKFSKTSFICNRCEDKGFIFDHFSYGQGLRVKRSCPNCQKEYWREAIKELGYKAVGKRVLQDD